MVDEGGILWVSGGPYGCFKREDGEGRPKSRRLHGHEPRWSAAAAFDNGSDLSKVSNANKGNSTEWHVVSHDELAYCVHTVQPSDVCCRQLIPSDERGCFDELRSV